MSKKREFPILNGKLISDLDANGHKIIGADIEVPAEKIKEAVALELEAKADKTELEAETQRATGVEATLGNAITAEAQRAQEAEAALRRTVDGKVDAVEGKGLSSNDYTNEDKEKLGTAYTPDNPPPAPDLSGYATKTAMNEVTAAVRQVQVSVDSVSDAQQSMGEALTVINDKADAALPRYYFTILEVVDGVVTVPPYTSAFMPGNETAFTIAVGEGNSMYLRDCILCVQCGDVAPTITWPANFHPRTDAETDFACVAGVNNVYWISEYVQGEFVVAGWQATAGGSAE